MHNEKSRQGVWHQWLMGLTVVCWMSAVGCDVRNIFDGFQSPDNQELPLDKWSEGTTIDEAKIEEAIQRISVLTQQAVQSAPPDYDKLLEAGEIAESLRPYFESLDTSTMPLLSQAFYNQACGYAVNKELDKAFKSLDDAIGLGFDDKKLMESDTDLDFLRADPRYAETMKKFEEISNALLEKKIDEYFAATSPFPFDFVLEDLEGKMVSLKDLRGSKVTIIDFWGTWCPPCRMEIPHFVALYKKLGSQGLQIIGINYERGEKEESITQIKEYSEDAGIVYPLVLGNDATRNQVPGFRGYPTTLFLDSKGIVRAQTVGYVSEEILAGIVDRILEKSSD